MATMIPKRIITDNITEDQVFRRLRDETPDDWVIFHSLHVLQKDRESPEEDSPYARELDFVILMRSIVLYLEVKGGSYYEVRGRQWYNQFGDEVKDPVEQARSGAFALLNDASRAIRPSHLKFRYGVLLTNTNWPDSAPRRSNSRNIIPSESGEWLENNVPRKPPGCLLIDGNTYLRGDSTDLKSALIQYAYRTGLTKRERRQLENPSYLGEVRRQQEDLQKFLAPSFSLRYVKVNRNVLQRTNTELLELTEQQYGALRLAEHNQRLLIDGAAGTGKTLLAVELARRRHSKGERVAIFCTSPNMAHWIRQLGVPDEVEIAPFIEPSYVLQLLCGNDLSRVNRLARLTNESYRQYDEYISGIDEDTFYEKDFQLVMNDLLAAQYALIDDVVKEFTRNGGEPPFDYAIVDEAQVLPSAVSLKMVDASLVGGIADGKWTMFGDFSNQNIALGTQALDLRDVLKESYLNIWAEDKLSVNCRNTQPIAETVFQFAAINSYETDDAFQIPGPATRKVFFKDEATFSKLWDLLDSEVRALLEQGIRTEQIVVLHGFHRTEMDDSRRFGANGLEIKDISEDYASLSKSHLNACFIDSFQGFESDVVIFMPARFEQKEDQRRILYTAVSRAKGYLIVIAPEEMRSLF